MFSRKLTRTEFGALMMERRGEQAAFRYYTEAQPEAPPVGGDLFVCWPDEKSTTTELPRLVVIEDNMVEDFFAWAITFMPAYRPLTSFLRVLPWTVFSQVRKTNGFHFEHRAAWIGLILGETLTNATGRGFMDSLPLTAFESTYSYAISRSMALGFPEPLTPYILRGWHSAREFGERRGRRLSPELLDSVWDVLFSLGNRQGLRTNYPVRSERFVSLVRACEEISERGQISSATLTRLAEGRFMPQFFEDSMRLPREQRVVAFERAMHQLGMGPTTEPTVNFVVGYLASLVGDGSLEHAHLVFPLQSQFPTAMLWYGICSSLAPTTRVLTDYGHLGVRLLRLLERPDHFLNPPTCDIALQELEVIFRGQPRSRGFRQTHASSLRIELAPCVTTLIRFLANQSPSDQPGLFGDEGRRAPIESERLRELIHTLKNSLTLAESLLPKPNSLDDPESSPSRSKRRR